MSTTKRYSVFAVLAALASVVSACSKDTGSPSNPATVQLVSQSSSAYGVVGQSMSFKAQLNTNGSISPVDIIACDPTQFGSWSVSAGVATLNFGNMGGSASISCSVEGTAAKGTLTLPVWVTLSALTYTRVNPITHKNGFVSQLGIGVPSSNGNFSEVTCAQADLSWDEASQTATCHLTIPMPPGLQFETFAEDGAVDGPAGRNFFVKGSALTQGNTVATGTLDQYGNLMK